MTLVGSKMVAHIQLAAPSPSWYERYSVFVISIVKLVPLIGTVDLEPIG